MSDRKNSLRDTRIVGVRDTTTESTTTSSITHDPSTTTTTEESTIHDDGEEELRENEKGEKEDIFDDPEARVRPNAVDDNDVPPNGGLRAWLVVLGASCVCFSTFGYVNAWGVFQSYYEEVVLPTTSPSTIAWIGSIEYALIFIPGLPTGRLFDMGYIKLPLSIASTVLIVATFLVAECKQYWQLLLCQGILGGLACGTIFGPMAAVLTQWFTTKKNRALGLVALGSSIGGTLFPIIARNLIPTVGFKWTMRILGFIQLVALTVAILTVARRVPPKKVPKKFMDFGIFRQSSFTVYCFGCLVSYLGIYTVLTFIDISAVAAGQPPDFTFYLVSIANAGSALGRIGGGLLADQLGPLNVMIPCTFFSAILTYAWPFAKTRGDFVAIAIIYGIFSGVFVSLLTGPIMAMGSPHDVGLKIGAGMTIMAMGAIAGPPVSGAINAATDGYKAVAYYAGSTVLVSVTLLLLSRYLLIRRHWGKA